MVGNPLCLGFLRTEAKVLARIVVFIWHLGSSSKLTGCEQNPFPCGCSTEVLIFLLAVVRNCCQQQEAACGSSLCGPTGSLQDGYLSISRPDEAHFSDFFFCHRTERSLLIGSCV